MANRNTGQPENVQLTGGSTGADIDTSNPLPVAVQGSVTASLATALNGIADQTATTSAVALGSLVAGPNGVLIRSHPNNDPASRIRVGTNAAANIGVPLAPGESWTFAVANANELAVILEASVSGASKVIAEQA